MKLIRPWCIAIMAIAFGASAGSRTASADTYQIFNLGNSGSVFFYGMDDSEKVVLVIPSECFFNMPCYINFSGGIFTGLTVPPPPALAYDNGTPCVPATPAGGIVFQGVCNNGRDAFTGTIASGQMRPDVYVGAFPNINLLAFGGLSGPEPFNPLRFIAMNGRGDVVWEDDFTENWYFALDTTTAVPEPESLALLGTGTLTLLGAIRRRKLRPVS